jgi:hypothetical protein
LAAGSALEANEKEVVMNTVEETTTTLTEGALVNLWRVEQLEKAGLTRAVAEVLADLPHEVDLNVVRYMRANGATPEQVERVMV